jgi:hypothetical protein
MYLTKSEVSHVAWYVGGNTIRHATTSGVVNEPIRVLLNERTIVLPCSLPLTKDERKGIGAYSLEAVGRPFNWGHVILKGLRIVFGRDPFYFRLTFVFDIAVVLMVLDAPRLAFGGGPLFICLIPFYLLVVAANMVLARIRPLPIEEDSVVKPIDILRIARQMGSAFHVQEQAAH